MRLEITEGQFGQQVEDLLDTFHWRWTHFRPARTEHSWRTALSGHPGFPDYVALRPPRLLMLEVKAEKGQVSPAQEGWHHGLSLVTMPPEFYLMRPSQWPEIEEALR